MPVMFVVSFVFNIIHGSRRAAIMGKVGNTYHVKDIRWCEVDVGEVMPNYLYMSNK